MITPKFVHPSCLAPLLASMLALWLPQAAQAQQTDEQIQRKEQGKAKPTPHRPRMNQAPEHHPASRSRHPERLHPQHPPTDMPHHRLAPSPAADIQIGQYFQAQHIESAKSYYDRPENMGFCPPGLAKKGSTCTPPGQAKLWRKGERLPQSVVVYDLPRSVVVTLGVPPPGTKYVRVASDILLIAIGTNMVIDAMEDLVR